MADIGELCSQLEARFSEREFDEALELSERILAADSQSDVGLRCRCACLVQLSRADDALALLDKHADVLGDETLLRGFCLYQKGELDAALALIEPELAAGADADGAAQARRTGLLHLRAQVLYKRCAYADAARAYRNVLAEDASASADEEVVTNATAAFVMAGLHAEALQLMGGSGSGCSLYELAYNYACAQIAQGDYAGAEKMLDEALALSTHALQAEEVADDEEVAAEQAAIRVQKAYVAQRTGAEAAAQEGYLGVLRMKGHEAIDTTVSAVAANNLVALRGDRDLFDSAKRCKAALSDAVAAKLLPAQRLAFLTNQVILTWHMGKPAVCREQIEHLEAAFPDSDVPMLLRTALYYRPKATSKEAPSAEAEAAVTQWAKQKPALCARPLLALAQMQARAPLPTPKGQPPIEPLRKAVATLASIGPLALAPRVVATASALLESLGDIDAAAAFLNEALDRLGRDKARLPPAGGDDDDDAAEQEGGARAQGADVLSRRHLAILRGAGAFFERRALWRDMAAVQEQLLKANPRDLAARARLVVAASHFDSALAAEHDALLPEMAAGGGAAGADEDEDEEGDVDAEALEARLVAASASGTAAHRGYQPAAAIPPAGAAVGAAAAAAVVGGKRAADKVAAAGVAESGAGPSKRRRCGGTRERAWHLCGCVSSGWRARRALLLASPRLRLRLLTRPLRATPLPPCAPPLPRPGRCARSGSASRATPRATTRPTRGRRPTPSAGCPRRSAPPTAAQRRALRSGRQPTLAPRLCACSAPAAACCAVSVRPFPLLAARPAEPLRTPLLRALSRLPPCAARQEERGADAWATGRGDGCRGEQRSAGLQQQSAQWRRWRAVIRAAAVAAAGRGRAEQGEEEGRQEGGLVVDVDGLTPHARLSTGATQLLSSTHLARVQ